jgi:hypothetical protein
MPEYVVIALITAFIQISGFVLTHRLTAYRIDQLEKKVEKYNNFTERLYVVEERVNYAHKRIDEIKDEMNEKSCKHSDD